MKGKRSQTQWNEKIYRVRVEGLLKPCWSEWFGGMAVRLQVNGRTLLSGPVRDQAGFARIAGQNDAYGPRVTIMVVLAIVTMMVVLCPILGGCQPNRRLLLEPGAYKPVSNVTAPVVTAPIVRVKPLPPSMKGYELYRWFDEKGDNWHFTLITGTNRLKTYEEITYGQGELTGTGWVKITVIGEEALKTLLVRLPPGTELSWRGADWLSGASAESADLMLPEPSLVDAIQDHCHRLGLQLYVSQ